ncbi:MAG TPA: tetratricopeptide repeat protein [Blastocatellia bacterium]|nr:tetratricopeptide repeat protein [Blastocatellia bacterium]
MLKTRRTVKASLASILFVVLALAGAANPRQSKLGKVKFPNSGSEKVQDHFIRGLAALHSFWFEEALDEFREATKIDPDFAMGYWGEAMAYNHPLWAEQDTESGRKTIAKVNDTAKMTARERAYVEAVRVLYGQGDKLTRDKAYSAAMEKVYRDYPDDLEAACFYSLSLLGTVRPGDKGFRRQAQAGAIALDVYQKNPDHPGAAHYIIHSFDDPEHAIIALPAARRYAEIAPEAHHARHMPAHIFLQLGMWPEAAASNESAWAVSDAWVKRKGLPIGARDYHSLHWLEYVYMQQGRYAKAEELLRVKRSEVEQSKGDAGVGRYNEDMAAGFIVETEQWNLASKLFASPANPADEGMPGHAAHMPAPAAGSARARRSEALSPFVRGLAAAKSGSPEAAKSIAELQAIRKRLTDAGEAYAAKSTEIMGLEVSAAAAASKGNYADAIEMMSRATSIEEEMSPPSGPPSLIKPSHELFGEILLGANRPKDAAKQFETALLRQPNRARSLLGVARAAAKAGDTKAATEAYSKLLRQWSQADPGLAELREAQDYLKQAKAN